MPIGTLFIDPEWYCSAQGKQYITALIDRSTNERRPFGLLEKPILPVGLPIPEEFEYKIFMSGKAGVGKTSLAAKLSANPVPRKHYETPGIQTSTVYWPALVTEVNRVVLFKLKFWDAGETALESFDHILPACKSQLDAVLYVFSFIDKSSFTDLPHRMTRVLGSVQDVYQFVLGTKYMAMLSWNQVAEHGGMTGMVGMEHFESSWKLRILSLGRIADPPTGRSDIEDIAPTLNFICDQLWERDQMLAGTTKSGTTD